MKKENENEKVQSKVEKTVEHKDKKDVTPEEKLNNIIKKAKEKGKIKDIEEAFNEFPVEEEWHKGKIENLLYNYR